MRKKPQIPLFTNERLWLQDIMCMDESGCEGYLPDSELRRFVAPKTLSLLERLRTEENVNGVYGKNVIDDGC
jgi:hypothetical protein